MRSLTSSSEAVGVATSPGKIIRLPATVILVRLGSSLWGLISQTTRVKQISLRRSRGMSLKRIRRYVSVPATLCFLEPLVPVPTPWHRRPNSLAYDDSQMSLNLGLRRSCLYSRAAPESESNTGHASSLRWAHHSASKCAGYFRRAAWAGRTLNTRERAAVPWGSFERVRLEMGADPTGV